MPNHVTTRLRVSGEASEVERFVSRAIVGKRSSDGEAYDTFDFNRFIFMPDSLSEVVHGSKLTYGLALHGYDNVVRLDACEGIHHVGKDVTLTGMLDWHWVKEAGIRTWQELEERIRKDMPDAAGIGRRAVENFEMYGATDWYSWAVLHWGTKWNAYDYRLVKNDVGLFECLFDTAWVEPMPVYEAVALRFPNLDIGSWWFDEGGCHAGSYIRLRGEPAEVNSIHNVELEPGTKGMELYARVYGESPNVEAN